MEARCQALFLTWSRWWGVVEGGRPPRAYCPAWTFWGAFPFFLLRRRARTSGGTVHRSAMMALAWAGLTGWPLVSQMMYGVPRRITVQARSARLAATTQVAP